MDFFFLILGYIELNIEINYINTLIIFSFYLLLHNSLSLPGSIIAFAASGYFFGLYIGFFISIISLVLGSLFFFLFFSIFLKKIFPKIYNNYSKKITNYIDDSSFDYLILLRLIPGPPLMLQNLLLSILNIKKTLFCLSTFIGFSPIVFISVFLGYKLSNFNSLKSVVFSDIFSLEFIIFTFFILVLIFLRIFYQKKKGNF